MLARIALALLFAMVAPALLAQTSAPSPSVALFYVTTLPGTTSKRWMKRVLWPGLVQGRPAELVAGVLGWVIASAAAADDPPKGMRPYDERVYTFAYDVFLANGNVADAFRVAQAAVAQRPDDLAWREKLARAAIWNVPSQSRPRMAN